nr:cytokine receptor-like factor 3 isoform X1 [Zootoca vivipara]
METEALLLEARESVEAARTYRRELQQRLKGLQLARQQVTWVGVRGEQLKGTGRFCKALRSPSQAAAEIKESAALTRDVLEQHFNDLKGTLRKLLDERLVSLLQEVDAIEEESIKPLDECRKLIEQGVGTADDLLREGETVIHGVTGEESDKLCSFTKKALHIQLDSLPEVPSLVDVPCLSAQLDDSLLTVVRNQIFNHGTVASRPPIQIEELIEKPGGIIVKWCKVDEDFVPQDYRLQYRKSTASHFEDVYVGSDTEFIVLHIDPNVDYQFRVCARGDGRQEWSPWSVSQTGRSTLVPHEWTPGFEGYSLSSRRNIALRNDSQVGGVLYSRAPTYYCGQTLTFRIETVGQPDKKDSIGVCVAQQNGADSLQRDKAVCVSTNGAVFVNGKEMTNQLPAVISGSAVTFDIEAVNLGPSNNNNDGGNFKLRVTIGSNNREVVFDWVLDQSCGSLYFGCSFSYPGWKVLVF